MSLDSKNHHWPTPRWCGNAAPCDFLVRDINSTFWNIRFINFKEIDQHFQTLDSTFSKNKYQHFKKYYVQHCSHLISTFWKNGFNIYQYLHQHFEEKNIHGSSPAPAQACGMAGRAGGGGAHGRLAGVVSERARQWGCRRAWTRQGARGT